MFKHLKFVSIPVIDQDRALKFYRDILGFVVKKDDAYGTNRWIELSLTEAQTYFLLEKDSEAVERSQGKPSVALIVDDVQATYEKLQTKNVSFTQNPTEQSWGSGSYALFDDSEGNTVIISDS